ncbi:MAG: hypothetical protein KDD28_27515 [Phaeodactylibacter sp.]|nr:hypothetical protein [Phaeodactylibacter sp.]
MNDLLINRLMELPQQIAGNELQQMELRDQLQATKQQLAGIEISIILEKDEKEWGSNADKRKVAQQAAFTDNDDWRNVSEVAHGLERSVIAGEIQLNLLRNTFAALRAVARLRSTES